MADIFYDDQADLGIIQDRHVAVLGYGSQGHAHALSLRDSGVDVRVGLPDGSRSRAAAAGEGLRVLTPEQACEESNLIMVLVPDHVQRSLYAKAIAPSLVEGDALFFAHGLNIRYQLVKPPPGVDVCMVAPKGPGHLVRRQFAEGRGVPVLVAVERDEGTVTVGGRPVRGPSPDRGMLFQTPMLFPWLTTRKNILFGPRAQRSAGLNEQDDPELDALAHEALAVPPSLTFDAGQHLVSAAAGDRALGPRALGPRARSLRARLARLLDTVAGPSA